MTIISTVDWFSWLFLCAAFFMMISTGRWIYTLLIIGALIGLDFFLNWLFFTLEARRICAHTPGWTMHDAKHRLRQRVERENLG